MKSSWIANKNNWRTREKTNKDQDHNDTEIFNELVKEIFDEITKLPNEINQNDLIYYFKGNSDRKRFNDFNKGIKLLEKIRSVEMKIEEDKKP